MSRMCRSDGGDKKNKGKNADKKEKKKKKQSREII